MIGFAIFVRSHPNLEPVGEKPFKKPSKPLGNLSIGMVAATTKLFPSMFLKRATCQGWPSPTQRCCTSTQRAAKKDLAIPNASREI